MSMKSTPILYFYVVKQGFTVRGIPIFLIFFYPKHRLWALVRTASVLSKSVRNIIFFFFDDFFIYRGKNLYIAYASFRNGNLKTVCKSITISEEEESLKTYF